MADFLPAYERMLLNEGGYKLHTVKYDRGGMTYAGIARNSWPAWAGWAVIDGGSVPAVETVQAFYRENFWLPIGGDSIKSQAIAQSIFDFAVNAGVSTASKLAQTAIGAVSDGWIGPKTLALLNTAEPHCFIPAYSMQKIKRYEQIVTLDASQRTFLLGWIRRVIRENEQ